jgi:hypothetical protein
MPAKNLYHDAVIDALKADGWTITHDPLTISFGGRDLYVDIGAERITIAAERGSEKIAVEVQSFISRSPIRDFEQAVGQFDVYRAVLMETEPDRELFLAVPKRIAESLLQDRFGQLIIRRVGLKVIVFDEHSRRIVQWTK